MTLEEIQNEFGATGRLSGQALDELRERLRAADPYPAITVAGDCLAESLAPEMISLLDVEDPMVRWNATATVFTRLRCVEYVEHCLRLARSEPDTMVRGAALTGLGETLPRVKNLDTRRRIGSYLLQVLNDDGELLEMRGAAYEGILAAIEVHPAKRPPASRLVDLDRDLDISSLAQFRRQYDLCDRDS